MVVYVMKRKIFLSFFATFMVLSLAACSGSGQKKPEPISESSHSSSVSSVSSSSSSSSGASSESVEDGSWIINENLSAANLPEEVQNAFDKATEDYKGQTFIPLAYIGKQIVSGTNYMLFCEGNLPLEAPEKNLVVLTIYENLEGNASISEIHYFSIENVVDSDGAEASVQELEGGWTIAEVPTEVVLDEDVQKAFDEATETIVGAVYEPLSCLGSKVASGTNYAVLCRQTLATENPVTNIVVVNICDPIENSAYISNVHILRIADYAYAQ